MKAKKKKNSYGCLKIQVSDQGPSWPSCLGEENVLGQDTSVPWPSAGETEERLEYVNCCSYKRNKVARSIIKPFNQVRNKFNILFVSCLPAASPSKPQGFTSPDPGLKCLSINLWCHRTTGAPENGSIFSGEMHCMSL